MQTIRRSLPSCRALAREELRHFEQVQRMLSRLRVPYRRMQPGAMPKHSAARCARMSLGAEWTF